MGSFIQKVFLIIGVTLIGGGKQRVTRGGFEGYLFYCLFKVASDDKLQLLN
jgi:hypothetical protein